MKIIFGSLLVPSTVLLAWWPKAVLSLIFLFDNATSSAWAALVRGLFVLADFFYPLAWFIALFGFFAFAFSKTKYSLRTSACLSILPYVWILCALGMMQVSEAISRHFQHA